MAHSVVLAKWGADQMMDSQISYVSPFESLRRGVFMVSNPFMSFFEVTGDDARTWLQGQLTNDVRKLSPSISLSACMCSPTGQVIAILKLWERGERLILGAHNLGIAAVLERFDRMVILEDVAISAIAQPILILQGQGVRYLEIPPDILSLELDRSGAGGSALLFESESRLAEFGAEIRAPDVDDETLRFIEVESGQLRFGIDTDPKTLPAELGSRFIDEHVNFEKGCYTGQEVVMRIHSRGHVNRQWVTLLCESAVQSGDELVSSGSKIGKILWSGFRNGHALATAFVIVAQVEGEITVLANSGETKVQVVVPPLFSVV